MADTRCSVVIRCYNEERHIERLLAGIQRQTLAPREVILVDSGSTDSTLWRAQRFDVRIVHLAPEEFSFGRALNLGFEAARSDIVVLASAHVYPLYCDWLEQLTAPLSDPQVSLCYGQQRGDHRTRFSELRIFEQWFPEESTRQQAGPFCNNANAAVRRSAWSRQRYDESLSGLEDLAWAKAAQGRGEHIAYVAEAVVAHVHQESWTRVFNRYRREAMALARIAPEESLGTLEFLRLLPQHIAADCLAARRSGRLESAFWDILSFRSAQLFGTYRGAHESPDNLQRLKRRFYYPAPTRQSKPPREALPVVYTELGPKEAE
jgi:rhamnosyltransferase